MQNRRNRGVLFLPLLLLCAFIHPRAHASSGTEGAAFLDIPVGAGPAALGSAYSALATNAYAPTWNPAGLGFLPGAQAAAQHLSYLESIHYEFASFVIPLKSRNGLGVSIQYLGSGDMAGTDPFGAPIGDFSSHYAAYSLAYGQKLTELLSLGMTAKIIEAKIADVSGHAYAGDVGALYKMSDKLRLAATVTNAGTPLKFDQSRDPLPLAFHAAAAYEPARQLLLSFEGVYSRTGLASVRTGLEWKPLEMVAIRAGYKTDTTKELSPIAGLTVGLGLKVFGQEFAYAWLPYGDLGDTQYFSLLIRFGHSEEEKRNLIQYQSIKKHRTVDKPGRVGDVEKIDAEYQQLMQLLEERKDPVAQSERTERKP